LIYARATFYYDDDKEAGSSATRHHLINFVRTLDSIEGVRGRSAAKISGLLTLAGGSFIGNGQYASLS